MYTAILTIYSITHIFIRQSNSSQPVQCPTSEFGIFPTDNSDTPLLKPEDDIKAVYINILVMLMENKLLIRYFYINNIKPEILCNAVVVFF